jgi:hypothetical protein
MGGGWDDALNVGDAAIAEVAGGGGVWMRPLRRDNQEG